MRVKLQRVMCSDDGQEDTITDVVTLRKDSQRIALSGLDTPGGPTTPEHDPATPAATPGGRVSRRVRNLPGLRDPPQSQRGASSHVPHLVWDLQTCQATSLPVPVSTAQAHDMPASDGSAP